MVLSAGRAAASNLGGNTQRFYDESCGLSVSEEKTANRRKLLNIPDQTPTRRLRGNERRLRSLWRSVDPLQRLYSPLSERKYGCESMRNVAFCVAARIFLGIRAAPSPEESKSVVSTENSSGVYFCFGCDFLISRSRDSAALL